MGENIFAYEDGQFIAMVHEVFGPTMQQLGFEFDEENNKLLHARKGEIQLIFRLESGYQYRLFSLEIKLLGELGERATSWPDYRHFGATAIAKLSNPNYKTSPKITGTEDEVRESMERQKAALLKYCKDILDGDITRWPTIVDSAMKEDGFEG